MRKGTIVVAVLLSLLIVGPASHIVFSAETLPAFQSTNSFHEQVCEFTNGLGVRIVINAPAAETFSADKPITLVVYALPNGNTVEQTIGKASKPGDDWHFNIQHIGAQTRFVRTVLKDQLLVVAYLENTVKSWPIWRKQHGDKDLPGIVETIKGRLHRERISVVLSGHSGGGSFIFGYINAVNEIPGEVGCIAFLDANYGYETTLHKAKLVKWLQSPAKPRLVVLAYHDDVALLNGRTFVSAAGGTWGKSHLMKRDFEQEFKFENHITPEWENYSALEGRVKFLLRDNPEKKILHTVQVERNGFIHALLAGTENESAGYQYFGDRAYEKFIQ